MRYKASPDFLKRVENPDDTSNQGDIDLEEIHHQEKNMT